MSLGRKKSVIGFRYYLGMHMVLCHGRVDSLNGIYADKKEVWKGRIATNQELEVDKPNLFGGERSEGGISGKLDVLFGDSNQGTNEYLETVVGNQPGFRGVL